MKYLLVFFVIMLVAFQWRSTRTAKQPPARSKTPAPGHPVDMVQCARCGVHLPQHEALAGARGNYCSTAHLKAAEH